MVPGWAYGAFGVPGSRHRARFGVAAAPWERWHHDGSVKMAALLRQNRNSRRHSDGRPPAGGRQSARISGAEREADSAALPRGKKILPAGLAVASSCACPADARGHAAGVSPCLTRRRSRIGSIDENARNSEGFDVCRRPMTGARGRKVLSEQSSRSDACGGRVGLPGLLPEAPLEALSPCVFMAFGEPEKGRGLTPRRGCGMRARRSRRASATCADGEQGRGTRLATTSSRVRFRLGLVPGIEERAG